MRASPAFAAWLERALAAAALAPRAGGALVPCVAALVACVSRALVSCLHACDLAPRAVHAALARVAREVVAAARGLSHAFAAFAMAAAHDWHMPRASLVLRAPASAGCARPPHAAHACEGACGGSSRAQGRAGDGASSLSVPSRPPWHPHFASRPSMRAERAGLLPCGEAASPPPVTPSRLLSPIIALGGATATEQWPPAAATPPRAVVARVRRRRLLAARLCSTATL